MSTQHSTVPGHSHIRIIDMPIWVKAFRMDGVTDPNEIVDDLKLIDDLLILQQSKSLLNRKKNLKTQLEARIAKELGYKTENLNIR